MRQLRLIHKQKNARVSGKWTVRSALLRGSYLIKGIARELSAAEANLKFMMADADPW